MTRYITKATYTTLVALDKLIECKNFKYFNVVNNHMEVAIFPTINYHMSYIVFEINDIMLQELTFISLLYGATYLKFDDHWYNCLFSNRRTDLTAKFPLSISRKLKLESLQ